MQVNDKIGYRRVYVRMFFLHGRKPRLNHLSRTVGVVFPETFQR